MKLIELNKKMYLVPASWNELTGRQVIAIMDCLFLKQYSEAQARLQLLKILTGMSWWSFFRCTAAQLDEFFYLSDFLLQKETQFTKQLLPEYDGLYAPESDFDNLLMKELVICDNLFMRWSEDRADESLLNDFVSVLYRPLRPGRYLGLVPYNKTINPEGDVREEFNFNRSLYRSKKIIFRWPLSVRMAIAHWYDGCRWQLVEENDEVFGGSGSEDVSKYGLISVMLSVAETGSMGTLKDVENQFVKTVMLQLNDSIAKAKAEEKKYKQ